MKGKEALVLFFLISAFAAAASGCTKKLSRSLPSESARPLSAPSGTENPGSALPSSSPETITGTVSQEGPVLPVKTGNPDFDRKFAANPLDKSYEKESADAVSNLEMIKISEKYAGLWQKEVSHAFALLEKPMNVDSSLKPSTIRSEQKKWEDGKTAALKKITADTRKAGSMAQIEISSKTMEFFRMRAARLYRYLSEYGIDFSYAFEENN